MTVKELRIGNWVRYNLYPNDFYTIRAICEDRIHPIGLIEHGKNTIYSVSAESVSELSPIPLNQEILEKAGFTKESVSTHVYHLFNLTTIETLYTIGDVDDAVYFEIRTTTNDKDDTFAVNHSVKANIKYVHELQNLFYSIENQELNITL